MIKVHDQANCFFKKKKGNEEIKVTEILWKKEVDMKKAGMTPS